MNPNKITPIIDYAKRKTSNAYIKAKQENKPRPLHPQKGTIGNWLGRTHSSETKAKMSQIAKEQGRGGVRASRRICYNGIKLGSTYELTLAKDLDANGIKWSVPKRIKYVDPNGVIRHYTADFYINEYDIYVDPKNDFLLNNPNPRYGFSDAEKIQCVMDQNNIIVILLDKTELTWSALYDKISKRLDG